MAAAAAASSFLANPDMIRTVAAFLEIPEAVALRLTCRAARAARPLTAVVHATLSEGISSTLARQLLHLESIDVKGIPDPIVFDKLIWPLRSVRVATMTRPIRPVGTFRVVQELPRLEVFRGVMRGSAMEASLFIETMSVKCWKLRHLEITFGRASAGAKAFTRVRGVAWPDLQNVLLTGTRGSFPVPWRKTLEWLDYTGTASTRPAFDMAKMRILVMRDDFLAPAEVPRFPRLERLVANVHAGHVVDVMKALPPSMERLRLAVEPGVTGIHLGNLRHLHRLDTLMVTGAPCVGLEWLPKSVRTLCIEGDDQTIFDLANLLETRSVPNITKIIVSYTGTTKAAMDLTTSLITGADGLDALRYLEVSRTAAAPVRKRKRGAVSPVSSSAIYRRRGVSKTIVIDVK
jgi:hypothetical protein